MKTFSWLIFVLCCAAVQVSVSAQPIGCKTSEVDGRFFRWRADPEVYLFMRPDSARLESLGMPCREKVLAEVRKIRGNGATHRLLATRLTNTTATRAELREFPRDYAGQIQILLGAGGPFDEPAELRIGADVLQLLASSPLQQGAALGNLLVPLLKESNKPLLTFEADVLADSAMILRNTLAAQGIECLIGTECDFSKVPFDDHFDYAVCDPATFPPPFVDQAAVSYARAFVREKPVIFRIKRACFYAELFWIATGAAGLRFEYEKDLCDDALREGLHCARGLASLMRIGRYRPLRLEPPLSCQNVLAVLAIDKLPVKYCLPTHQPFQWHASLAIADSTVYPFWLDVRNDIFVEYPPIQSRSHIIKFADQVPTKGRPYVFGFVFVPSHDDRATTIGPITPLDGE